MSDQHTWHQAVLPQVIAAVREEVGEVLTEDQLHRVAVAAMSASVAGIASAAENGLLPKVD